MSIERRPKSAPVVHYPFADWILRRGERRGPVTFGWLGRPYAYLVGPQANEFVFAHDDHFSASKAFEVLIPVDGPTSVVVSEGAEHARRRGLVRPGLHRRQVEGYVDAMARTAEDACASVRPGEVLDGYALFRSAIRRSNLRTLFGERMGLEADALGALLQPLIDLTDLLPDALRWHQRLGTPRWRRAMVARAKVDAFVDAEIARVRGSAEAAETQVLATLVHGRDGAGSGLSDQEIRDQVVTLIAAGYETTSAAMGWALYCLGGRPGVQRRAREQVLEVTGGARLAADHLPQLTWVSAVLSETLRLYPPAAISARYVTRALEFEGRTIRSGTTLIYSPYATHRSADVFPDPLAFRPERWLDEAKPGPGAYVPFGGGAHRCLGSTMAMTELTVMLATALRHGEFALEPGRVRATGMASMRPDPGVRMRWVGAPAA